MATKAKDKVKTVNCPGMGQPPAEVLGTLPVPKTSQHHVEGAEVADWGRCKVCGAKRPLLNGKVTHHRVSQEKLDGTAKPKRSRKAAAAKETTTDATAEA